MTTITIDENTGKDLQIRCSSKLEAAEMLLEQEGYLLLKPVVEKEILAKLKKHRADNKNRDLDTYDDI